MPAPCCARGTTHLGLLAPTFGGGRQGHASHQRRPASGLPCDGKTALPMRPSAVQRRLPASPVLCLSAPA
jgi:hypothetical protein